MVRVLADHTQINSSSVDGPGVNGLTELSSCVPEMTSSVFDEIFGADNLFGEFIYKKVNCPKSF